MFSLYHQAIDCTSTWCSHRWSVKSSLNIHQVYPSRPYNPPSLIRQLLNTILILLSTAFSSESSKSPRVIFFLFWPLAPHFSNDKSLILQWGPVSLQIFQASTPHRCISPSRFNSYPWKINLVFVLIKIFLTQIVIPVRCFRFFVHDLWYLDAHLSGERYWMFIMEVNRFFYPMQFYVTFFHFSCFT